jgi:hypothetical protein
MKHAQVQDQQQQREYVEEDPEVEQVYYVIANG